MDEKNYNSFDPERLENFENEAEEIIKKLKEDAKFRQRFFYGTAPKKCNMARLRSKIIKDIKDNYHVIVSDDTFNEIVYLTLWAGGSWKTLDTYSKQCTFFAWLRSVAKNAVMEMLEDEHWIDEGHTRTVGNTRLTMLSQSEGKCKLVIDELMAGSKYYELLTDIYVERLSKDKILKKMNMEEHDYETFQKKAEYKLKDALLRSDYHFEADVLHDKSARMVTISSDFVADMAELCKVKTGANPLSDVFGTNLSDEEVYQKTVDFLYDFSEKLWPEKVGNPDEEDDKIIKKNKEKAENNKRDRLIWCERFIKNTPPMDVADKVNRDRGWLDTRYSRLNEKFEKAIKLWWNSRAA